MDFGRRRGSSDKPERGLDDSSERLDSPHTSRIDRDLKPLDRAKEPAVATADMERVRSLLRDADLTLNERMVLKEITHLRNTRPRPDLPREAHHEIREMAFELGQDPARVQELARDPDHGGTVTRNSVIEVDLALRLEQDGRLRNVVRDPRVGCGDLIEDDGSGRQWDVYGPRAEVFRPGRVESQLKRKIELQRQDGSMIRVIINTADLAPDQVDRVQEMVRTNSWDDVVMFGTSRRIPREW